MPTQKRKLSGEKHPLGVIFVQTFPLNEVNNSKLQ